MSTYGFINIQPEAAPVPLHFKKSHQYFRFEKLSSLALDLNTFCSSSADVMI